jgi:dethiobiotin synthetase
MHASGVRVAPMKPVESGPSTDAAQLRAASGVAYPMHLVRPVSFEEPLAPLVAGRRAHAPVDLALLDSAFAELCSMSDAIVVEGAGGLLVPITESESYATLFKRWDLPLVIVAANRLGVLNHTLLTVEVARAHGLDVRAVVLNTMSPDRPDLAERTNQAVLKELLRHIPVISFPYTATPTDPSHLATLAREFPLRASMARPA